MIQLYSDYEELLIIEIDEVQPGRGVHSFFTEARHTEREGGKKRQCLNFDLII